MPKQFKIEIKSELKVLFHNPVRTYLYFIKGAWANHFTQHIDLKELSEDLLFSFTRHTEYWEESTWAKEIEGFPTFYQDLKTRDWVANHPETGKISIVEIEYDYVDSIEEIE